MGIFSRSNESKLVDGVRKGNVVVVESLLKSGVNPNKQQENHLVSIAVERNDYSCVELLLVNGACVDNGRTKSRLFFDAIRHGNCPMVKLLMKYSVTHKCQNMRSLNGWKPIHWASYFGNVDILELLIQENSSLNLNEMDNYGFSPLSIAAFFRHKRAKESLLAMGAHPDYYTSPLLPYPLAHFSDTESSDRLFN